MLRKTYLFSLLLQAASVLTIVLSEYQSSDLRWCCSIVILASLCDVGNERVCQALCSCESLSGLKSDKLPISYGTQLFESKTSTIEPRDRKTVDVPQYRPCGIAEAKRQQNILKPIRKNIHPAEGRTGRRTRHCWSGRLQAQGTATDHWQSTFASCG